MYAHYIKGHGSEAESEYTEFVLVHQFIESVNPNASGSKSKSNLALLAHPF